jgi:hypothetical protein
MNTKIKQILAGHAVMDISLCRLMNFNSLLTKTPVFTLLEVKA